MYNIDDLARVIQHQQQQINWLINRVNQLEKQMVEDSNHLYERIENSDSSIGQNEPLGRR